MSRLNVRLLARRAAIEGVRWFADFRTAVVSESGAMAAKQLKSFTPVCEYSDTMLVRPGEIGCVMPSGVRYVLDARKAER